VANPVAGTDSVPATGMPERYATGGSGVSVDHWPARLRELGYPDAVPIGAGMDGGVYALDDARVAKVWWDRTPGRLAALAEAYEELAGAGLPFATPRIERIVTVSGRTVSVERRLTGMPLSDAGADGYDQAVSVLAALGTVTAGPALAALPVLGEATSPWWPGARWGAMLSALLARRMSRHAGQLRAAVPGFDRLLAGTYRWLDTLPTTPTGVLHGDLCPPNVLVDRYGRVTALLDWGLLTTRGDPAFDAGTFAGFFDMYSPRAREHADATLTAIERRLGYPRELLLAYRGYYALIGANLYDPAGADGHFGWCVATLTDPAVRAALS